MQLDLSLGEEYKRAGPDKVTLSNQEFVVTMRIRARRLCATAGSVTADDLRLFADAEGIEPAHPNAWGAIFRGAKWVGAGYTKNQIPSNHARVIQVWKYRNDP